jgi:hypothetical protein
MCFHSGFKKFFDSQKVGTGRSSVGKFSALGHATRPSYGGPKFDFPDFPLDFALWNFASVEVEDGHKFVVKVVPLSHQGH